MLSITMTHVSHTLSIKIHAGSSFKITTCKSSYMREVIGKYPRDHTLNLGPDVGTQVQLLDRHVVAHAACCNRRGIVGQGDVGRVSFAKYHAKHVDCKQQFSKNFEISSSSLAHASLTTEYVPAMSAVMFPESHSKFVLATHAALCLDSPMCKVIATVYRTTF